MGKKANASKSIEALSWQWTEKVNSDITDEDIRTSYRLCLPKCNACRKNCSGNPTCLHNLGEAQWLSIANVSEDSEIMQNVQEKMESLRRKKGDLVGLHNLGATCYVNTYLQLWFHNIQFRNAIYALQEENVSTTETSPQTLCGQLQLMFGLLQNSLSKFVDPTSFINCLGLPTDLQQDAQEFSKLFMCLLETTPGLSEVIQSQFSGKYAYVTKCLNCSVAKETPAKFYELDLNIQGHKDLKSCVLEFLKEEQLLGDNQYFCNTCSSKEDAIRKIVLKELPHTLSIQLLRFVYDRASQTKRKITTNVSFPDKLDFASMINSGDKNEITGDLSYRLTAVLLHRGPSASSGHFVTNILDSTTGCWYTFNDEVVHKMKSGKKLDLNIGKRDDDIWLDLQEEPALKKPKLAKGEHSSKDVYMLVYSKTSSNSTVIHGIPTHIQRLVEERNRNFEDELLDMHLAAQEELKKQQQLEKSMKEFVNMLNADSDSYEWIRTSVLKQFLNLNQPQQNKKQSSPSVLCVHGNINLTKLFLLKRIPKPAADRIYNNNAEYVSCHGGARFTDEMLCYQCVFNRCMLLQGKRKLNKDFLLVNEAMKSFEKHTPSSMDSVYYVGRQSLRKWKSLALQKLLKTYQTRPEEADSNTINEDAETSTITEISDTEDPFIFNSDILCFHKQLTEDASTMQVVPECVWQILFNYFPESGVFELGKCVTCPQCLSDAQKERQDLQLRKTVALQQKIGLSQLYANRNRPSYESLFMNSPKKAFLNTPFYIVSDQFVTDWIEFVKHPDKNGSVKGINNTVFLCQHKKLFYDPLSGGFSQYDFIDQDPPIPMYVFLWENEWAFIKENFTIDHEICFQKRFAKLGSNMAVKAENHPLSGEEQAIKNGLDSPTPSKGKEGGISAFIRSNTDSSIDCSDSMQITSRPDLCEECMKYFAKEEKRKLFNYQEAEIFVVKSTKTVKEVIEETRNEVSSSASKNIPGNRRSSRARRCARGEKKISSVSSLMTLKELKVKIMTHFSVPPFDQNLYMNGVALTGDERSLGNLSVLPGSTITLVEDLPNPNDAPVIFDIATSNEIEVGFQGTSLLGHG